MDVVKEHIFTMRFAMPKETALLSQDKPLSQTWRSQLRVWLFSWELYPIILVASFLRLYQINITQFDQDQANVYRMAYDAVHHGLVPATATIASLGNLNMPATLYIYMLPAALSDNPLWGTLWMTLLGIGAVFLTYIFVRKYYGRLAGALAAILFATVQPSVDYSRFIWNPNPIIFLMPIFMITLFIGVVDRRKGWFFPAAFLLGLIVQLHNSSIVLVTALLIAVVLAPRTIRWRDLALASISLLILYAPYLLWEVHSKFNDIFILLHASKQPNHLANQAISYYQLYLDGYVPEGMPQNPAYPLISLIKRVNQIMTPLLVLAGAVALIQVLLPRHQDGQTPGKDQVSTGLWGHLRRWWSDFRADTYRCGLLILLVWQVMPLVYLSHLSIPVYIHYLMFLMPGQYILIAFLLAKIAKWLQRFNRWGQIGRYVTCLLAILIIVVQGAASLGYVVASSKFPDGHFIEGNHISYGYSDSLKSLQDAFAEADQLAQQRHLKHLYIATYNEIGFMTSVTYLAEHTHTPTTVFNQNCLVLPNPADGPAVLLEGPYNDLADTLLPRFASATLVDEPKRIGGDPFKLYIVETHAAKATVQASFPQEMQLLDTQRFSFQDTPWAVTHWNVLHSSPTRYQTTYTYNILNLADNNQQTSYQQCFLTSMQAGDQLLRAFPLQSGSQTFTSLDIQVQSYTDSPVIWEPKVFNPLGISFETGAVDTSPAIVLQTDDGKQHIVIPIPKQETGGSK